MDTTKGIMITVKHGNRQFSFHSAIPVNEFDDFTDVITEHIIDYENSLPRAKEETKEPLSKKSFIVLWTNKKTHCLGAYTSRAESIQRIADVLFEKNVKTENDCPGIKEGLQKLKDELYEEFKLVLNKASFKTILWRTLRGDSKDKHQEMRDIINDWGHFTIDEFDGNGIFSFNDYTEWDYDNLYTLLQNLNNRVMGDI